MGRYTKIHLGPARKNDPQVTERIAGGAGIVPGCLVVLSANQFVLAAATTVGKVWLAQENYLMQKNVDQVYTQTTDTVLGLELQEDCLYAARIANGVNITAVGVALTPAANGLLGIAATSDLIVAYSDEIYSNNTGATQLIRVRPAGSNSYLSAAT